MSSHPSVEAVVGGMRPARWRGRSFGSGRNRPASPVGRAVRAGPVRRARARPRPASRRSTSIEPRPPSAWCRSGSAAVTACRAASSAQATVTVSVSPCRAARTCTAPSSAGCSAIDELGVRRAARAQVRDRLGQLRLRRAPSAARSDGRRCGRRRWSARRCGCDGGGRSRAGRARHGLRRRGSACARRRAPVLMPARWTGRPAGVVPAPGPGASVRPRCRVLGRAVPAEVGRRWRGGGRCRLSRRGARRR